MTSPEIDRGPRLLKAQQTKISRQEDAVREAHESLKRLKVTSHEREGELKTTLQQISKHEKQLNEAGSKKDDKRDDKREDKLSSLKNEFAVAASR